MDFLTPDITNVLDIGLGAVSLMLWWRQGKVNKAQVELDTKQNKAAEDLTTMVKDHEVRIENLETDRLRPARRRNGHSKNGKGGNGH